MPDADHGTTTPMDLRSDIPALQERLYLNYGAHGPSPRGVVEAAHEFLETHEYESPVGSDPYDCAFDAYDQVRERVAELIGATAEEIALTESTTAGINAVADGIEWSSGDVVVRTDLEHPAGVLPWQRLERDGIEVRVVKTNGGRIDTESFKTAVRGANLVCFSAVTWTHGTRLPVSELVDIAHEAGAFTLVDAVQVPGQMPMDVTEWGADAVAAAGHKWLLGLWGGGFLYVDSDVADDLKPHSVGYRSVETPTADPFRFATGAGRFEIGTANPAPHVALANAIDLITAVGIEHIEARIDRLTDRLAEQLPPKQLLSPEHPESGLVTIDVPDPEATVERLAADDIVIRSLPEPNGVRASIHAVNTAEEIDHLATALETEY
jgi:selenocysteine lyase/cysteine desulfurase